MKSLKDLPVYVINLDRRIDRWNDIQNLLQTQGFSNIQRVSAIDGKLIDSIHVKKLVDSSIYDDLGKSRNRHEDIGSLGAVGCYLSHYKIWRNIIQTGVPSLIMEDDIQFEKNWDQYETVKDLRLLKDHDLVLLGYWPYIPQSLFIKKNTLIPFHERFFMTHFYYLTPKGAEFFLNQSLPMKYQVDSYMSMKIINNLDFKSAAHSPSLAGQNFLSTDIQTPVSFSGYVYIVFDYVKYYTCSTTGLYLIIFLIILLLIYIGCKKKCYLLRCLSRIINKN